MMRLIRLVGASLIGLAAIAGCANEAKAEEPSTTSADKSAENPSHGLVRRTLWTTSHVVGSPEPPLPYRLARRFAKLKFDQPLDMVPEPGSSRLFVVEREGRIVAIDDNNGAKDKVEIGKIAKEGYTNDVYSLVFHPDYERNGYVFAFVQRQKIETPVEAPRPDAIQPKQPPSDDDSESGDETVYICRYVVDKNQPRMIQAGSETPFIQWRSDGHSGGDLAFGPDGFLYVTAGDGTSGSDTRNTGQDITDLQASILRIDVDRADGKKRYSVPPDNPFLHIKEARPEIWAFGLRQPWRISFDPPTGDLWVGDVGQDLWEMIHLVKRGGNYGWSVREGNHPFFTERKVGPAPISPPIVEHHHSESRSITGGFVYRAARHPELVGHYIYCDYETGMVWGFRYEGGTVHDHRLLADSTYKVASFGQDHAGEVYLLALSGEIFELEPNPAAKDAGAKFPRTLAQTGLFADVAHHRPAEGLISYSVNAEGWTDGAHLQRYIAIPGKGKIGFAEVRGWEFPEGSVLVQTVSLGLDGGNSSSEKRIETRILTRQQEQWHAYTFLWNNEQTDATLVDANGLDQPLNIRDSAAADGTRLMTWHVPSRSECMGCHSRAANWVLGPSTLQMNRDHDYDGVTDNQLRALDHAGLFKKPLIKPPGQYPKLVDPYDVAADLNARARSYLHANCSHCHVADGGGNARMELEVDTRAAKTQIFDVAPLQGDFDIVDARLIAPGDPYRSVILYRISKLGRGRMPRLGSSEVDQRAVRLLHDWIGNIPPETSATAAPSAAASLREGDSAAITALSAAKDTNTEAAAKAVDRLLSTTNGAILLLSALYDGRVNGPVAKSVVRRAAENANVEVRDLFETFLPESQRLKRLGSVFDPRAILAMQGDPARGAVLFFKTAGLQCQTCHQIKGQGREVGPDLSAVGKKLTPPQILESIIDPSKAVEEKFATYLVETTDGLVRDGLLVEKNDREVVLRDGQNQLIRVPAANVELMVKQRKSLMPELLLRDVTAQQAADLLAYLSSLK